MPVPFTRYPFEPDKKRPAHLKKEDYRLFVYTTTNTKASDLNRLIASTDDMTVAQYQLAPGGTFDPVDVHAGDEIYYILSGQVTMLNAATGQTVIVNEGEAIIMPKGAPHKAYNFTDKMVNILFVIAPKIWDDGLPPEGYDKPVMKYKSDIRER